jgi:glycerol-3-phosphate dehydrogenase (NAD(P)+)
MGGKLETIVEAGVVGDLVLTCYSKTSRNTKFGYELAMNQYPNNFLEHYPDLVEGVHSTKLIMELMKKYNINLPIVSSVANSIWNSPLHPLFSKEKTSTPSI